jgi:hypothetical protein
VDDEHLVRRHGTPEGVANPMHRLAPDEARYASGRLWVLGGGPTTQVQQLKV